MQFLNAAAAAAAVAGVAAATAAMGPCHPQAVWSGKTATPWVNLSGKYHPSLVTRRGRASPSWVQFTVLSPPVTWTGGLGEGDGILKGSPPMTPGSREPSNWQATGNLL